MSVIVNNIKPYHIIYKGAEATLYHNGIKIWPEQTATLESYKLSIPISNNLASWGVGFYFRTKDYASIPVTATSGVLTTGTTISALSTATLGSIFTGSTAGWMCHNEGTIDLYINPTAVNQELIYKDFSMEGYWPESAYYYNHYSDNSNILKDTWTEAQLTARPVVFSFNVSNS